jgi:hypothetical protein
LIFVTRNNKAKITPHHVERRQRRPNAAVTLGSPAPLLHYMILLFYDIHSSKVNTKLDTIWETMNPNQRLPPYVKKAKAAVPNFFPKRNLR